LYGEGRLARARQVAHRQHDEGRERLWSERAVKVALTVGEEEPEGGESSRGERAGRGLNHRGLRRTGERSKALKAGARSWSPWVKLGAGAARKRQEGNGGRRARAASRQGKPLKSEPWTWLRGEINPRSSVEEEAVEDVRNVEDGTKRAWDARGCGLRRTMPR